MNGSIVSHFGSSVCNYVVHGLLVGSETSPYSCPKESMSVDEICTFVSQVGVHTTLNDSIERLGPLRSSFEFFQATQRLVNCA
jgi:hypothetical protein